MRKHLLRTLAASALVAGALLVPAAAGAAAPSNDDFANATIIDPSASSFSDTVSLVEATLEPGESNPCGVSSSVWYSFTPSRDAAVRVTAASSSNPFGAVVTAYSQDGVGIGGLSSLGCTSFFQSLTIPVRAGTTYYFQGGDSYYSGASDLQIAITVIPQPANNDFASATAIGSLPFSDSVDGTAATIESGEPTPSWVGSLQTGTAWYRFSPSESGSISASGYYYDTVAAYSGNSLGSLTEIGCKNFGGLVTFHADAGTTYYFQLAGLYGNTSLQFQLMKAPAAVASLSYSPGDPSTFDAVQFSDQSYDPGGNSFSSEAWHFGDGSSASNPGCCPTHQYAKDGTYTVELDVTTTDGRTASTQQVVHVQTHDVSIAKVLVPQTASVGQTRTITVGLTDSRYPEVVQVQLLRSVAGGGWQQVGASTQSVPVRGANRTTNFTFNYTFAPDDAMLGKVSFQAIATIQNARDAIPTDNTFISLPTRVTK